MSNLQGAEGLRDVRGEEGAVFMQLGEGDAERKGISLQNSRSTDTQGTCLSNYFYYCYMKWFGIYLLHKYWCFFTV